MKTFKEVSEINLERAKVWHPRGIKDWSGLEWGGAACGEAGELVEAVENLIHTTSIQSLVLKVVTGTGRAANAAKKLKRAETGLTQANQMSVDDCCKEVAKELGDTYLYMDLLAQRCGIDMFEAIRDTFNRVSDREGFEQRIE